jgi:hypothetical protein
VYDIRGLTVTGQLSLQPYGGGAPRHGRPMGTVQAA